MPSEKQLQVRLLNVWQCLTVFRKQEGTDTSSSHFPLYNPNGTIIGGMAIIRDVTERVRAERRLNAEHDVTRILAESATLNEASQKSFKPSANVWNGILEEYG